jgi:ankyrin repeat protein
MQDSATPLMCAAATGNLKISVILLNAGADINGQTEVRKYIAFRIIGETRKYCIILRKKSLLVILCDFSNKVHLVFIATQLKVHL